MGKRKNGFVIYFEEYISAQKNLGRHISKKIAVEECGPKWQKLSDDEKKFYNDLANEEKCKNLQVRKQIAEKTGLDKKINDAIKYLTAVIDGEEALKNHKFYVVHTNYYCKTSEALYVPAELAVAEFNLKNGVLRTCHSLIDPGEIPLGYAYDAKRNSDEIHGIPLPPYEEGIKNFDEILEKIMQFMEPSKQENQSYAPLFTIEKNVDPTMNVLEYLMFFKYGESVNSFAAYPIHKLLFWIKNKSSSCRNSQDSGFPVESNAWAEIERDIFRYSTGISCEFHKDFADKYHNCSLSVIQRLIYVICDHCCRYLNIDLVPGKHVPVNFAKNTSKIKADVNSTAPRAENSGISSSVDDLVASGRSQDGAFGKKMERQRRAEEVRLVPQYDDDGSSSDDDFLVTIGRGKRMTFKQRTN